MVDMEDTNAELNRSVVEFSVSYISGVHTKGRKKGKEIVEQEIITLIVPFIDQGIVQDYIRGYCIKNNMQLIDWNIEALPGKRHFEFDCQHCGEHSIDMNPMNQKFCSNYCKKRN